MTHSAPSICNHEPAGAPLPKSHPHKTQISYSSHAFSAPFKDFTGGWKLNHSQQILFQSILVVHDYKYDFKVVMCISYSCLNYIFLFWSSFICSSYFCFVKEKIHHQYLMPYVFELIMWNFVSDKQKCLNNSSDDNIFNSTICWDGVFVLIVLRQVWRGWELWWNGQWHSETHEDTY